jgi:hypothetical protein
MPALTYFAWTNCDAASSALSNLKFASQISRLAHRSIIMWLLLLVPFVGLLWVPFYNSTEPSLFGFPFFYWYQLAWVPISSLLTWLVYRRLPRDENT